MARTVISKFEAYDRKIFWAVAVIGMVTLFSYVYFVSISVFAVVGRKESEIAAGSSGARVAQLESEYAALDRSIDLGVARHEGFREVLDPHYVSRESAKGTLSLRGEVDVE